MQLGENEQSHPIPQQEEKKNERERLKQLRWPQPGEVKIETDVRD